MLLRFGYHFSSLIVIIVLLALGVSAFRSVVYATVLAFLLSFLHKPDRMTPRRIGQALSKGALGVLPVAATCAAAGIIVGGHHADRARARAGRDDRRRAPAGTRSLPDRGLLRGRDSCSGWPCR